MSIPAEFAFRAILELAESIQKRELIFLAAQDSSMLVFTARCNALNGGWGGFAAAAIRYISLKTTAK